ncbi:MAG: tRNA preQ1(34) S-adenosylmethionine ribosyltransferase-isomerase QueA [Planctomycetota bacterium]
MSETLQDYDFDLPKALIAQYPITFRDHCRLLFYSRVSTGLEHRRFYHLPDFLQKGDLLVFNDTRVLPSRCYFFRATGGRVEIFVLKALQKNLVQALVRGKVNPEEQLFCEEVSLRFREKNAAGHWIFESSHPVQQWLEKYGKTPLPPYIKRAKENDSYQKRDEDNYQTIFAKNQGAVASPTAGLHFTPRLLDQLQNQGVEFVTLTLHIGLGTFQPIEENDFHQHLMHSETYQISEPAQEKLLRAKHEGRRIIAVGTTSVRALESAGPALERPSGETQIFIYPPYSFHWIQGLITNFHFPKSTLLLLVAALIGRENLLKSYQTAIQKNYRFFSYGDAMLIL